MRALIVAGSRPRLGHVLIALLPLMGNLKGLAPGLGQLQPLDLTVVATLLALVSAVTRGRVVIRRREQLVWTLVLLLAGYMLMSLMVHGQLRWTSFGFQKVLRFIGLDLILLPIILMYVRNAEDPEVILVWHLRLLLLYALAHAFLAFLTGGVKSSWVARFTPEGVAPIAASYMFGWGIILLVFGPGRHIAASLKTLLSAALVFLMVTAAERGPLIALAVALSAGAIAAIGTRRGAQTALVAFTLMMIGVVAAVILPEQYTVRYWLNPLSDKRLEYWATAWDMFLRSPMWGNGPNSWSIAVLGVDGPNSPHQVVLELLAEFGVVGAGLYVSVPLAAVAPFWRYVRRLDRRAFPEVLVPGALYMLTEASVASQVYGWRLWWFFVGLALTSSRRAVVGTGTEGTRG